MGPMSPMRWGGFDESRTGAATAHHTLHAGRDHARRSRMGCGVGYRLRPRGDARMSIALVTCGRGAEVLSRRRRGGARPAVGQAAPATAANPFAPHLAGIRARPLVSRGAVPLVSPLLFQRLAVGCLRRGSGQPLWVSPGGSLRAFDTGRAPAIGLHLQCGRRAANRDWILRWESLRRRRAHRPRYGRGDPRDLRVANQGGELI